MACLTRLGTTLSDHVLFVSDEKQKKTQISQTQHCPTNPILRTTQHSDPTKPLEEKVQHFIATPLELKTYVRLT
eukprot:4952357-Amphidinium_carterae.1